MMKAIAQAQATALAEQIRNARTGNGWQVGNGFCYLVLVFMLLGPGHDDWWSTASTLLAGIVIVAMAFGVAVRVSFPAVRKLMEATYGTDMHLPWWGDVLAYGLCAWLLYRVPSGLNSAIMAVMLVIDFVTRLGWARAVRNRETIDLTLLAEK